MDFGVFYAYWDRDWAADPGTVRHRLDRTADRGFDVLELRWDVVQNWTPDEPTYVAWNPDFDGDLAARARRVDRASRHGGSSRASTRTAACSVPSRSSTASSSSR